jgi:hypothetical protein
MSYAKQTVSGQEIFTETALPEKTDYEWADALHQARELAEIDNREVRIRDKNNIPIARVFPHGGYTTRVKD